MHISWKSSIYYPKSWIVNYHCKTKEILRSTVLCIFEIDQESKNITFIENFKYFILQLHMHLVH